MLEKILNKMIKTTYPERNIRVEKIGGRFFIRKCWIIGNSRGVDYKLEGTYSYKEVVKFTDSKSISRIFVFCPELGPVAIIGTSDHSLDWESRYLRYKVHSYGTPYNDSETLFRSYTEEEAKKIKSYTVYGINGTNYKEIAAVAPISEIFYGIDSRFKAKRIQIPKIFDMDCKLKGVYSYKKAKKLSTGRTIIGIKGYFGEKHPIVFATIENGQHIGIINMWQGDKVLVRGFRDVWEYGTEEPKTQKISFLTKKEASKIKDFSLYVYNYYSSGIGRDKYQIEKYDRTLDKRFKFQLPDGTDYRLVEHKELFE